MRTSATARQRAARALAALLIGFATIASAATPSVAQNSESVVGSGSTFAKIAIDQWISEVFDRDGLKVEYRGEGSTSGRTNLVENPASFSWASSDISFEVNEREPSYTFDYMPLVAGGTAMMYNLIGNNGEKIAGLRLSPKTVAGIFFGKITTWNDAAIRADNADNTRVNVDNLPPSKITPIYRASGSGTSAVFTGFLAVADRNNWQAMVDASAIIPDNASFTSTWPTPTEAQQACNAGQDTPGCQALGVFANAPQLRTADLVVQQVARTQNSIGYAEYAYAEQNNLDSAFIRNISGRWILPEARNVAVALKRATRNADGTQNLADVFTSPETEAYPISSYNYAIVPTDASVLSSGEANTLSRFLLWAITQGQATMAKIGYSPLPRPLVQQGLDVIDSLPNGAVDAPALGVWGCYYEELRVPGSDPDPECDRFDPNNPGVPSGGGTVTTTTTTPRATTTTTPRSNAGATTTTTASTRSTTTTAGSGRATTTTVASSSGSGGSSSSGSGSSGSGSSGSSSGGSSSSGSSSSGSGSSGSTSGSSTGTSSSSNSAGASSTGGSGSTAGSSGSGASNAESAAGDTLSQDDDGSAIVDDPLGSESTEGDTAGVADDSFVDPDDPFADRDFGLDDSGFDPDDPFADPAGGDGSASGSSGGENFTASEFATGRYLNVDGQLRYTNPATQEVLIVADVDGAGRTNWWLVLVALVAVALLLGPAIVTLRRQLTS